MKRKKRDETTQPSLPMYGHGGRREGAGRPRNPNSGMSHLERAPLASKHPVHVTTRLVPLPSLRRRDCFRVVRRALANGAQRPGFRLIEFSVQSNHIHMLCEGKGRIALARGIQGLLIRIARAVNRHLGRRGRVFGDRYHDRILRTPSEVRNALAYVLNNHRRHAAQRGKSFSETYIDRFSSAPAFYGVGRVPVTLPNPHSWLLMKGWKRAGPVRLWEIPGGRGT